MFDFNKLKHINCNDRNENEKYLLKNVSHFKNSEKIHKIGYPITIGKNKEIKGRPAMYYKTLLNFVYNNLINLDKENVNEMNRNKKPEVYVDFSSNPYGKLKIKINYSSELSKERLSLSKNMDSNNILFIFLDSMSRVHFYRQFKKNF